MKQNLKSLFEISKIEYFEDFFLEKIEFYIQNISKWTKCFEELDLEKIHPIYHPFTEKYVPEKDLEENPLDNTSCFFNAPEKNQFYFFVPKIKNE